MRLVFSLALLALAATAAQAVPTPRKPAPTPVPVAPVTGARDDLAPLVSCTLGVSGPRSFVIDYLQPPDDSYFLSVSPGQCAACASAPGVWISSVKIALDFRAACSLPVEVAVVAPVADTACAPPRPPLTIGGPWPGTVSASTPGIHDFTLSLGRPVAIIGTSYLQVRFTGIDAGCNTDATRPRLVTTSSCSPCVAWNFYPADTADMCALLLPGTPVIWASVDSCVSASLVGVPHTGSGDHSLRVWPNPARAGSDITFALAARSHVRVTLHDVSGRRVRELLDQALDPGEHALRWDGRDALGAPVPAGTYFVVVRSDEHVTSRSVVFVR